MNQTDMAELQAYVTRLFDVELPSVSSESKRQLEEILSIAKDMMNDVYWLSERAGYPKDWQKAGSGDTKCQ